VVASVFLLRRRRRCRIDFVVRGSPQAASRNTHFVWYEELKRRNGRYGIVTMRVGWHGRRGNLRESEFNGALKKGQPRMNTDEPGAADSRNHAIPGPECLAISPLRSWRLCERFVFCRPIIGPSFHAALRSFGLFNASRKGGKKENLSGRQLRSKHSSYPCPSVAHNEFFASCWKAIEEKRYGSK
jgi:hypothetical protein